MILETTASILIGKKVLELEEKVILAVGIHLEVLRKSKRITNGMEMKATFHEESLNAGLKIPKDSAMSPFTKVLTFPSVR